MHLAYKKRYFCIKFRYSICTNLYCKPTDSHNYLLYSSEHPRHLLNGIPYSQFVRIKRLCSKPEDFRLNALMLITHFIRRGYPKHLVSGALEKADNLNRDDLLNKETLKKHTDQTNTQKFYCVTTHNPQNPPLRQIITSNWDILGKTKTTRPLLYSEVIFGLRVHQHFDRWRSGKNRRYQTMQETQLLQVLPPSKQEWQFLVQHYKPDTAVQN